jgi:signal peptidase I
MTPTFASGDLLVVSKQAYRVATPERGDVVVARTRAGLIVKRLVGLSGEGIEVKTARCLSIGTQSRKRIPCKMESLKLVRANLAPANMRYWAIIARCLPPRWFTRWCPKTAW